MTITVTFDPPLPSDSTSTFNTKAFNTLGDLNNWSTQANALAATVNSNSASAATDAGTASSAATTATTQAGIATSAASTATTQAGLATAAYDSFDDRYLGSKTSNPTLDNDGNALLTGALYWNSTASEMRVYTGSTWTTLATTLGTSITANSGAGTSALTITQTGAGNALVVEDSASTDSTPFVVDTNGNVIVGYTTKLVAANIMELHSIGGVTSIGQATYNWNSGTGNPQQRFYKSKSGTIGTPAIVASGDTLGLISAHGDDGTAFLPAAQITFASDGTPGVNDMPGRITFSTTADGAATVTERMRIDSAGNVGIATTASAGTRFSIGGSHTGASTYLAASIGGTVQSDVADYFAVRTGAFTQATAFTLASLTHYTANQGTIGAGSSVTNQYGFRVFSTLTGATNNYGVYSDIASGTGRYNFYASGTAANYFAGETTVNSGLTIGRTAVTAPASTDGNVFSGTYTPTLTNTANVASSTAFVCQYMRVGTVVTVSGAVTIQATAAASTATVLGMSVPVASNFTSVSQCSGTAVEESGATSIRVYADSTNDRMTFAYPASTISARTYSFVVTYLVA